MLSLTEIRDVFYTPGSRDVAAAMEDLLLHQSDCEAAVRTSHAHLRLTEELLHDARIMHPEVYHACHKGRA